MEKTIFTLKKVIILCVNYRTLHVKQPDVASGVQPETKPLCGGGGIHNFMWGRWGHTWPGGRVLRKSGRGQGRMGEKEKRKVIFSYSFSVPPKMPCPYFFTTPPKKEKPFFRQLMVKNYLG